MKLPTGSEKSSSPPPEENPEVGNSTVHTNGNGVVPHPVNDATETGDRAALGSDQNLHEEALFKAVDDFCASSEQTYEQFVGAFTYFKPDDDRDRRPTLGGASSSTARGDPQQSRGPVSTNDSAARLLDQANVPGMQSDSGSAHLRPPDPEQRVLPTEDLEGIVLSEGTRIPSMLHRPGGSATFSNHRIKIGNFVEDEVLLQSDDDTTSDAEGDFPPYVASFASGSQGHVETRLQGSQLPESQNSEAQDSAVHGSGSPSDMPPLPPSCTPTSDILVCPKDISKNPGDKFNYSQELGLAPGSDSDQSESEEGDDIACGPSWDRLNPGEIESDPESGDEGVRKEHVRHMEYSARMCPPGYGDPEPDILQEAPRQKCSEHGGPTLDTDVVPFCLDEDFDYDNVILTPKYSLLEMEILKRALDSGARQAPGEAGNE